MSLRNPITRIPALTSLVVLCTVFIILPQANASNHGFAASLPPAPELFHPLNGFPINSHFIRFTWSEMDSVDLFQLQIDNNANFTSPVLDIPIGTFDTTIFSTFYSGVWNWHVRARNAEGWGNWSAVWIFVVPIPSHDTVFIENCQADNGATTAEVRILFATTDSVGFFNFPLAWSAPLGGIRGDSIKFAASLSNWQILYDTSVVSLNFIRSLGYNDLNPFPPVIPPLCTGGLRQHCLTAYFTIDPLAPEQQVALDTIRDPRNGSVRFGLNDGITEVAPAIINGIIDFGGCVFAPGDVNGDGTYNGLDVGFAVNYLKGLGRVPIDVCICGVHGRLYPAADANGNCAFNGIDVTYSVNYLKGSGLAPAGCIDCLPTP